MNFDEFMRAAGGSATGPEELAEALLVQSLPFVFEQDTAAHEACINYFARRLGVRADGVVVVGSSKLGFSLNPKHPGTAFRHPESTFAPDKASDIDVVIFDEHLFDSYWALLTRWRYPWHVSRWKEGHKEWGLRVLENSFAGQFHPNEIRYVPVGDRKYRDTLKEMAQAWYATFMETSLEPLLGSFEYKGRLYRTRDHAVRYHAEGIRYLLHKRS